MLNKTFKNQERVILTSALDIECEIVQLGQFVIRFVNGNYEGEYDIENPCGYSDIVASRLFPSDTEFKQAVKFKDCVVIIMENGDIVEVCKSNQQYFDRKGAIGLIDKLPDNCPLVIKQNVSVDSKEYSDAFSNNKETAKELINQLYNKRRATYINFNFEENPFKPCQLVNISSFVISITAMTVMNKIQIGSNVKLIQSNKFREHMNAHIDDFIVPYQNILRYLERNGQFSKLTSPFTTMKVELPFNVGYSGICDINEQDTIVYAKRKNRDVYSKFTMNGSMKLVNTCIIILKQSFERKDEYYIVTMFPGEYLIKEVQDRNIKSENELKEVLAFWDKHALVFKPEQVDLSTVTNVCPY